MRGLKLQIAILFFFFNPKTYSQMRRKNTEFYSYWQIVIHLLLKKKNLSEKFVEIYYKNILKI